jgi:hypothetical protein
MTFKKTAILPLFFVVIALNCLSCKKRSFEGMIIVTETIADIGVRDFTTGESWRYIPESRIVAVDPDKPSGQPEPLTGGFYSACCPCISPDGKLMIFTGQVKKGDPWQIWMLDLAGTDKKQVTNLPGNCTDPAFLPGNRVVFSMLTPKDSLKAGHSLYTCKTDGSDLRRITFSPHTYLASHVMNDGRILSLSRTLFPEQGSQNCTVLRPDGTKADLFYAPGKEAYILNRPWETSDGKIVFIESSDSSIQKGEIVTIKYNRPLHSKVNLTGSTEGEFYSAYPEKSGKFLVSYRKSASDKFCLYEFDPVKGSIGKEKLSNSGFNILEAVVASPYVRPKLLPSEVDMQVKTGLIMCQDINVSDSPEEAKTSAHTSDIVEIMGIDSSLGAVKVAKDGSFYLKVKADTPFRFRKIDDKGNIAGESCDWIWLRPNERRGCVGCHEDHELAPENRIPLAVKKSPVVVPVHVEKLKEKTVELE